MARAESLIVTRLPVSGRQAALQSLGRGEAGLALLVALVHMPLGLALYMRPSLAIFHPILVLLIGLYWAVRREYSLAQVGLVLGYIVGAEVLWRMAQVPIYWEFGKYGFALIAVVALTARRRLHMPGLPLVYFLALLPACMVAVVEFYPADAKGTLSSNMAGPLALFVACWFFSCARLTLSQVRLILFAAIMPLLSVACVTLFFTVAIENIQFNTESNFATSGGFGPNQVSTMLGLGVFLAVGCIILLKNDYKTKLVLGSLAAFFAAQCMLTFSRSGIYNAVGGLLVLLLFHFRNLTEGLKRVIPVALIVLFFLMFVFPVMNDFTGGKLGERFAEANTTNRAQLFWSDVQMFQENPVFGVGVGISKQYRERILNDGSANHTEFSRLISEHGSFGLIALLCLGIMTIRNVAKQRSIAGRALIAGVSVWAILYMFNSGMRLVAPSFIWGLSFVSLVQSRGVRSRLRTAATVKAAPRLCEGRIDNP